MQSKGRPPAWQTEVERWLRRSRGRPAPALVLGGWTTGLSVARSLGRRRVPVLLLEGRRGLPGRYTRFAQCLELPPALLHPQGWLEVLEFVGARLARPAVLFPTGDEHCQRVAQHAAQLQGPYRFAMPAAPDLGRLLNKRTQYQAAQAAGLLLPETHYPTSAAQARELAGRLQYPCLIKPCIAHTGRPWLGNRKLLMVESPEGLAAAFESLADSGQPFMAQAEVPGPDCAVFGYSAFWDDEGRELAWVTVQKLRQNPPHHGDGSLLRAAHAPEVAELSRRFLRALRYRGHVGIEFKYDHRDGTYRFIELNPRMEAFVELAVGAGVDLAWISYQYLVEGLRPAPHEFRPGVTYVHEEQDFHSFSAYRAAGALTAAGWLRSLRGARPMIMAWDDPLPFIAGLARFARSFLRAAPAAPPSARP